MTVAVSTILIKMQFLVHLALEIDCIFHYLLGD